MGLLTLSINMCIFTRISLYKLVCIFISKLGRRISTFHAQWDVVVAQAHDLHCKFNFCTCCSVFAVVPHFEQRRSE